MAGISFGSTRGYALSFSSYSAGIGLITYTHEDTGSIDTMKSLKMNKEPTFLENGPGENHSPEELERMSTHNKGAVAAVNKAWPKELVDDELFHEYERKYGVYPLSLIHISEPTRPY